MDRLQLLLGKLAEEACEIGQIALKTQHFGMDEKCPGQPYTNAERCHQEINDLLAIIEMLNDEYSFKFNPSRLQILAKKKKVNKYAEYSAELGQLAL